MRCGASRNGHVLRPKRPILSRVGAVPSRAHFEPLGVRQGWLTSQPQADGALQIVFGAAEHGASRGGGPRAHAARKTRNGARERESPAWGTPNACEEREVTQIVQRSILKKFRVESASSQTRFIDVLTSPTAAAGWGRLLTLLFICATPRPPHLLTFVLLAPSSLHFKALILWNVPENVPECSRMESSLTFPSVHAVILSLRRMPADDSQRLLDSSLFLLFDLPLPRHTRLQVSTDRSSSE
eukprot:4828887-Pleurochrysis_carterae.AAC.1